MNDFVSAFNKDILPEVHEHYSSQLKLVEKGYWAYDFCLPMLVLHTLYHHSNRRLLNWLKICPRKQFTTLDTHEAFKKPVVRRLLRLMKFRNSYPAFDGEFHIEDSSENQMVMTWVQNNYQTTAAIDLNDYQVTITYFDPESDTSMQFEV